PLPPPPPVPYTTLFRSIRNPRHPASSTSVHAEYPSGFLKVDPPVRVLVGCVDSRRSVISRIRARISSLSPDAPSNTADVKITPLDRKSTRLNSSHVKIS